MNFQKQYLYFIKDRVTFGGTVMEYKLDSRKIKFRESNLKLLGQGVEGRVYRYKDMALKLKDNDLIGLSYENAKYMSNIRTTRILLPKNIFYKNNHYAGYTTKYVGKSNSFKLIDLEKEKLINHIIIPIEEDIELLSNKQILLNDISIDDVIANNSLYIIDPGSYTKMTDLDKITLTSININQFNNLLVKIISLELKRTKQNPRAIILFREELLKNEDYFSSFVDELLPKNASIKELVKRISVY